MDGARGTTVCLPRIKVCGLTSVRDVRGAIVAGADALGFVHYPRSPRHVEAAEVAAFLREAADCGGARVHVPPAVLVLVDATPDEARALWEASGATFVQLCGAERAEDWVGSGLCILRRVPASEAGAEELERWSEVASGFVLDHPGGPGGTGQRVDASLAQRICAAAPCLLAGGLDEANVEAAVREAAPFGVDASSRLESEPRHKDHDRVVRFVENARRALGVP